MNLVCTLSIYPKDIPPIQRRALELGLKTIKEYAEKCGADFKAITESKNLGSHIAYEKFQMNDFVNDYDRVLYIDNDIIIHPNCENLFQTYKEDCFYGLEEGDEFIDFFHSKSRLYEDIQSKNGSITWKKGPKGNFIYYNTGMFLFSKQCNPFSLYDKQEATFVDTYFEQTYINYLLQKYNIRTHRIECKHNYMLCFIRKYGWGIDNIIHFAGNGWSNTYNKNRWECMVEYYNKSYNIGRY